jgi:Tfp pilus assembly protein PilF
MEEISVQEFVRRLKMGVDDSESRYAFFLGAGCSLSSGISTAETLVRNWLPLLKKIKTGSEDDVEKWIKEYIPDYDKNNLAIYYGKVLEDLFPAPDARQREIERLMEQKDPGFGYAVLAQLVSNHGRQLNTVLTTNFDDMVADALYLYTNKKPLVIAHDSLVGFVKISRSRPLIIKLHGDARLSPRNTDEETKRLDQKVKSVLKNLLMETALVFIGYGGNDKSIVEVLNELPEEALQGAVYWVRPEIPNNEMGKWLNSRNAIWVNHLDFDELMLLVLNEFGLSHPQKERFDKLVNSYFEKFKILKDKVESKPDSEEKKVLEKAVAEAASKFKDWYSFELEAQKNERTDADKTEAIYKKGMETFPKSFELIGNYASFLYNIRKDYDQAETFSKRALEIDPNNSINLGNYANFLKDIRRDYDQAETFYKRSIDAYPNDFTNLGNYANFLKYIRKNYDQAETFYKRALEIDPNNSINLGNYALFLEEFRRDYDQAEIFYKRSIDADPNGADTLGNYAGFMLARGNLTDGLKKVIQALKLTDRQELIIECHFYRYAHDKSENLQTESLAKIKELIKAGVRSPGFNLQDNVNRAIEDGHPQPKFLKKLAKVISDEIDAKELDKFAEWK